MIPGIPTAFLSRDAWKRIAEAALVAASAALVAWGVEELKAYTKRRAEARAAKAQPASEKEN